VRERGREDERMRGKQVRRREGQKKKKKKKKRRGRR